MGARRIPLCGVTVDVETDHAELAEYLAAQFPASGPATGAPDVAVRVRWTEGDGGELTPAAIFPTWATPTRIDRHLWAGPRRLVCVRVDDAPQIAIASDAGPPGGPRRFDLRFHFSLGGDGWRETAKRALRWRRLPALRRGRLSTLTYYAVYYPSWWHLEARRAAHPLHAAGVAVAGRGLLLAGLPGCGKSTLATAFLGAPDSELLADNVVLYDAAQIHGCFEPLLLDAKTRTALAARVPLEPIGRRHQYARDAFHAPHRSGGVPLGAAVILARAAETRLERLESAECARMLLAINEAAKEVRRYHILAATLALVERDALGHVEQRLADLERLLAGVPCYWLEVRDGAPAEALSILRTLVVPAKEVAS